LQVRISGAISLFASFANRYFFVHKELPLVAFINKKTKRLSKAFISLGARGVGFMK
jgi:hypothetical protein